MIRRFWLLIFFVLGCQTSPVPNLTASPEMWNPYGIYEHRVTIQVLSENPRSKSFRSLISHSRDFFEMEILGPMGISLGTIREEAKTGLRIKNWNYEELKKRESDIEDLFEILKLVMSHRPTEFDQGPVQVTQRDPISGLITRLHFKLRNKAGDLEILDYSKGSKVWPNHVKLGNGVWLADIRISQLKAFD